MAQCENVVKKKGKGTTKHCCWGNCTNDSRYPERFLLDTFFIRFPKPGKIKDSMTQWEKDRESSKTEKAKIWAHACGRKGFTVANIKKDTYICSQHFIGNYGPTEKDPHPILATLLEKDFATKLSRKRKEPKQREPLPPKKRKTVTTSNEENIMGVANADVDLSVVNDMDETLPYPPLDVFCNDIDIELVHDTMSRKDVSTQTSPDKLAVAGRIENVMLKNELNLIKLSAKKLSDPVEKVNPMEMNFILKSEIKSKYFIGLTPKDFWILYSFLGDSKFHLSYWNKGKKKDYTRKNLSISVAGELFITLLRLRRGFNLFTLSHLYHVSEYTIRTIFTTWIMFLFHHFKSLNIFPERQLYRKKLPKVFQPFKNIRASIDCTEFKCETPRNYKQQGNLYSSYKSHCTMKCLIAVNPFGAACFVSDLFEGSISDVEIFDESGILQHVNIKDSFLVDKGFTVQHLLLRKQATIYIPPFLGGRTKFTKEEVMMTKRIAKARIHVERFNERLKKFRLLDRIIPLSLIPIASQLVFVGSMLVNFQECLCK